MNPVFYTTLAADQARDYMPATPMMVTATSYFRIGQRRQKWRDSLAIPPAILPPQLPEVAADPGGFEANRKYGGSYPFTWQAYTNWLAALSRRNNLTWAAMPDLPCERELAADDAAVRARQEQTWRNAWHFIMLRRHAPWAWVPTIQGNTLDDYVYFARQVQYQLLDLPRGDWAQYRQGMAHPAFRVGIGSLCRREAVEEIVPIVAAVVDVLGRYGFRFHLWGVKLDAIPALVAAGLMPYVASFDSSAWNNRFGSDIDTYNAGMAARGMSQREYAWHVMWPRYIAKVDAALATAQPALAA